jgi:hypothetical protein
MGSLADVTDRAQAVRSLRQANARLDLLERAASQIGTTLDIHRTAGELAGLAVPELADRVSIHLCDQVLQGENPRQDPRTDAGVLRFRRVVVRDATRPEVNYKVGDLIIAPITGSAASAVWRGKPILARNPAEMTEQVTFTPNYVQRLLARGVHTVMVVPLIDMPAGLMLGAGPSPYPATDIRLPAGSVLALYTDGLIEQPGQDITTGMTRLTATLTASTTPALDDLCHNVLTTLGTRARDDIALLLARTTAQTAH